MVARTSSLLSSDPKTEASVPTGSSRLKGHSRSLGSRLRSVSAKVRETQTTGSSRSMTSLRR